MGLLQNEQFFFFCDALNSFTTVNSLLSLRYEGRMVLKKKSLAHYFDLCSRNFVALVAAGKIGNKESLDSAVKVFFDFHFPM